VFFVNSESFLGDFLLIVAMFFFEGADFWLNSLKFLLRLENFVIGDE
jgi:hypothetical protein